MSHKFTRVGILMLVIILGAVAFLIHLNSPKEQLPRWITPKVSMVADNNLQTLQHRIDFYWAIPPYLREC